MSGLLDRPGPAAVIGVLLGAVISHASRFWESGIPRSELGAHLLSISYDNHESDGTLAAEIGLTNPGNREIVVGAITVGFATEKFGLRGTVSPALRSQVVDRLPLVIEPGQVELVRIWVEASQENLFHNGDLVPPKGDTEEDLRRSAVTFLTWSVDADGQRFAARWEPCLLWVDQTTRSQLRCDTPTLDLHDRSFEISDPGWMRSIPGPSPRAGQRGAHRPMAAKIRRASSGESVPAPPRTVRRSSTSGSSSAVRRLDIERVAVREALLELTKAERDRRR